MFSRMFKAMFKVNIQARQAELLMFKLNIRARTTELAMFKLNIRQRLPMFKTPPRMLTLNIQSRPPMFSLNIVNIAMLKFSPPT